MRINVLLVQALNLIFWMLTVLLLLCIVVVPFLAIDENFNIAPTLSLATALATWDASLLSALWNSVVLSVIASLFAILCGSIVSNWTTRKPVWLLCLFLAVYSINPVARALSYFDLFQIYTPLYDWSALVFGTRFSTTILLPALILGIHYFPIYLMRSVFVLPHGERARDLPPLLRTMFEDIPVWVRGFPISFALFFLLTFFDYWVIQVISGNTVLYWTPLFVQKALQARAVSQAALMIGIGLLVTFCSYLVAWVLSSTLRAIWRTIRPLWFASLPQSSALSRQIRRLLAALVLLFLCWPLLGTLLKLALYLFDGTGILLMGDTGRAILVTLLLGCIVGAISATLGLILSAMFRQNMQRFRWWLPSLYVLALVPEAAFVLFSVLVTGSGVLRGNLLWLGFLMASFSIPISFFLWESLWGEREVRKLWLLGTAMQQRMTEGAQLALREWKTQWGIVFIVIFWLTVDNVFITDFAGGPKWKPLSVVIFNATKRGFSREEFFSSVTGSIVVLGCIVAAVLLSRRRRNTE